MKISTYNDLHTMITKQFNLVDKNDCIIMKNGNEYLTFTSYMESFIFNHHTNDYDHNGGFSLSSDLIYVYYTNSYKETNTLYFSRIIFVFDKKKGSISGSVDFNTRVMTDDFYIELFERGIEVVDNLGEIGKIYRRWIISKIIE